MQVYYGNAIRGHTNDLAGMKKACWAVFYHSLSSDQRPQHHCCPEGADSWCKYQRALALNQGEIPPHTPKIPAGFEKYLKPIFEDLCEEELLRKCLLGATQNRNESFNKLVWARAPKTEFVGRATIEIATSHAVIVFNSGRKALLSILERMSIHAGPLCTTHLERKDSTRIKRAVATEGAVTKQQRKLKRAAEKGAEEAHVLEEGITYEAGGF